MTSKLITLAQNIPLDGRWYIKYISISTWMSNRLSNTAGQRLNFWSSTANQLLLESPNLSEHPPTCSQQNTQSWISYPIIQCLRCTFRLSRKLYFSPPESPSPCSKLPWLLLDQCPTGSQAPQDTAARKKWSDPIKGCKLMSLKSCKDSASHWE